MQTPSFENLLQENLANSDRQETLSLVNETNSNSLDDSDNEENARNEEPPKQQRKSVGRRQNAASQKLVETEQINICIGEPGPLTCSMYNLIKDMNSVRSNVLSPGSLFSLVCKKYVEINQDTWKVPYKPEYCLFVSAEYRHSKATSNKTATNCLEIS